MKSLILSLTAVLSLCAVVSAAPVGSVESTRAGQATDTIHRYLSQATVVQRLDELGVSRAAIDAQLAKLSDTQMEALAADIELVQAGGQIQGGNPHPWGTLECIFEPIGRFFYDVYQVIFCWGKLK